MKKQSVMMLTMLLIAQQSQVIGQGETARTAAGGGKLESKRPTPLPFGSDSSTWSPYPENTGLQHRAAEVAEHLMRQPKRRPTYPTTSPASSYSDVVVSPLTPSSSSVLGEDPSTYSPYVSRSQSVHSEDYDDDLSPIRSHSAPADLGRSHSTFTPMDIQHSELLNLAKQSAFDLMQRQKSELLDIAEKIMHNQSVSHEEYAMVLRDLEQRINEHHEHAATIIQKAYRSHQNAEQVQRAQYELDDLFRKIENELGNPYISQHKIDEVTNLFHNAREQIAKLGSDENTIKYLAKSHELYNKFNKQQREFQEEEGLMAASSPTSVIGDETDYSSGDEADDEADNEAQHSLRKKIYHRYQKQEPTMPPSKL